MQKKHRKEIEKRLGNPRVYDKATELLQKWGMDDHLPSPESFSEGFKMHGAEFMQQLGRVLNMHQNNEFVNAGGDDEEDEPVNETPENEESEDKWWETILGMGLSAWNIYNQPDDSGNNDNSAAQQAAAKQAAMNRNIMIGFGALIVIVLLVVILKK